MTSAPFHGARFNQPETATVQPGFALAGCTSKVDIESTSTLEWRGNLLEIAETLIEKMDGSPLAWSTAFPWMRNWSMFSKPRNQLGQPSFTEIPAKAGDLWVEANEIAELIIASRSREPLSTTLPFVPLSYPISQHYKSFADETSSRPRITSFADIAESTPNFLLENYKIGGSDTIDVLPSLVIENVLASLNIDVSETSFEEPNGSIAIDDIDIVVEYLRGISDLPADVKQALARLSDTSGIGGASSVAEILADFANLLDEKERAVLVQRIARKDKLSLQQIADQFGVVRERIRQIENVVEVKGRAQLESSAVLTDAREALHSATMDLTTVKKLRTRLPELCEKVDGFDLEAWQLLDYLDKEIEADDEWIAVPSLTVVKDRFVSLVEENSEFPGAILVETLGGFTRFFPMLDAADLAKFIEFLGFKKLLDMYVEPSRRSVNDLAELMLLREGDALKADEIHSRLPEPRSLNVVKNSLSTDPRFVRTGPGRYGLAEWGIEEYQGIRSELIKRVKADGEVNIDDITAEFVETFKVASTAVYAYASAWPLALKNKLVTLADTRPVHVEKISSTKNVYLRQHGVALRLIINGEHIRGSGTPISKQFGVALRMREGDRLPFESDAGTITLTWVQQVQLGSILPLIRHHEFGVGDEVFVEAVAGRITLRKIPDVRNSGILALAEVMGLGVVQSESEAAQKVKHSLDLSPNVGVDQIESCLLSRGEKDFAAVLNPTSANEE